jgi:hypothetical protein
MVFIIQNQEFAVIVIIIGGSTVLVRTLAATLGGLVILKRPTIPVT